VIAAIIAVLIAGNTAAEPQQPSAGKLVSSMLARYAKAQTLVGTITLTQTIAGSSGQIVTEVQYERPTKLFIRQTKKSGEVQQWIVSSTGKIISYNEPSDLSMKPGVRLAENQLIEGKPMPVQDVYMVASLSLGDRSVPLDAAISARARLEAIRGQWASMALQGRKKIGEVEANKIVGKWREGQFAAVSGIYEMYITDEGDLLRYVTIQNLVLEANTEPKRLESVWDCSLKVDAKPDQKLFVVYP
jgi:hypothetical protein